MEFALHGVGMPGHFLVGGGAGEWFDPSTAARASTSRRARRCSRETHTGARFRPQFLMPVGSARDRRTHARQPAAPLMRRDPRGSRVGRTACGCASPEITLSQRGELAGLLGRLGQFAEAAREFDVLARLLPGEGSEQAAAAAARLRARTPTDPPQSVALALVAKPLPMFPLGTVLFPHAVLPLHIFEHRYRALAETCLRGDGRFGVVLIERGDEVGGGDTRFGVGTVARIVEAARTPDGRYLLATVGTERFRVRKWLDDDPYPRAEIDVIGEPKRVADAPPSRAWSVQRLLGRVLAHERGAG